MPIQATPSPREVSATFYEDSSVSTEGTTVTVLPKDPTIFDGKWQICDLGDISSTPRVAQLFLTPTLTSGGTFTQVGSEPCMAYLHSGHIPEGMNIYLTYAAAWNATPTSTNLCKGTYISPALISTYGSTNVGYQYFNIKVTPPAAGTFDPASLGGDDGYPRIRFVFPVNDKEYNPSGPNGKDSDLMRVVSYSSIYAVIPNYNGILESSPETQQCFVGCHDSKATVNENTTFENVMKAGTVFTQGKTEDSIAIVFKANADLNPYIQNKFHHRAISFDATTNSYVYTCDPDESSVEEVRILCEMFNKAGHRKMVDLVRSSVVPTATPTGGDADQSTEYTATGLGSPFTQVTKYPVKFVDLVLKYDSYSI